MYLVKRLFQDLIKIVYTLKNEGLKVGILSFGEVIRRIVYSKAEYYLMAHNLDLTHMKSNLTTGSKLVIRQIKSHEDIEGLSPLRGLSDFIPDPINWMKKVFDDGGIGFIAFYGNQPIGCGWISFKITPELMRIPVTLKPGDAYLHALFVMGDKRNLGGGRVLAVHRLSYLKEKGFKRGMITVLKNNTPALRVHQILGYDYIGEIIHTRFLLWDFYKHM
ncbi:MAG: GNAT family N-acetyltransferase [Tissierellales bacterium]|nr:GNAT family N-acetyltransferase [Tissierellales bacterium]